MQSDERNTTIHLLLFTFVRVKNITFPSLTHNPYARVKSVLYFRCIRAFHEGILDRRNLSLIVPLIIRKTVAAWACPLEWKLSMSTFIETALFMFLMININKTQKKILRLQRDSNPWPPRYRCDALPTELWSLARNRSSVSSIYTRYMKRMTWSEYDKYHEWTADKE